jgi:hypothetical protein
MRENQVPGILIIKFMKSVTDKLEKLCIKWLNENFNPMEPFYMEEYPDYIFHMKDGKCILQHNKKNGYVYVSYREIWKFFESYFSMDNQQIKDITKIWVEEHYKMGATTTRSISRSLIYKVEEHYKMGVTTTHWHDLKFEQMVEEHYKMEATMTNLGVRILNDKVEEHYKMGVTSIQEFGWRLQKEVDEQYNIQTNG